MTFKYVCEIDIISNKNNKNLNIFNKRLFEVSNTEISYRYFSFKQDSYDLSNNNNENKDLFFVVVFNKTCFLSIFNLISFQHKAIVKSTFFNDLLTNIDILNLYDDYYILASFSRSILILYNLDFIYNPERCRKEFEKEIFQIKILPNRFKRENKNEINLIISFNTGMIIFTFENEYSYISYKINDDIRISNELQFVFNYKYIFLIDSRNTLHVYDLKFNLLSIKSLSDSKKKNDQPENFYVRINSNEQFEIFIIYQSLNDKSNLLRKIKKFIFSINEINI
jgi:hypothetical protein